MIDTMYSLYQFGQTLFAKVYTFFADFLVILESPVVVVLNKPLELLPDDFPFLDIIQNITLLLNSLIFNTITVEQLLFASAWLLVGTIILVWILNWLPIF